MKEVTMKLYPFSELSDEVKKGIVEKVRFDVMGRNMDAWSDDWEKSLSEFEKLTDTTLKGWEVSYCGYHTGRIRFDHDGPVMGDWENGLYPHEVKGKHLYRYLCRNILPYIIKRKTYWGKDKYVDGKYAGCVKRASRIKYSFDGCPLTGYCGDYSLVKPILDYCKEWPKHPHTTLVDLYKECYDGFMKDWYNDYQGSASDEFVMEELENSPNYEDDLYFEDGVKFAHARMV